MSPLSAALRARQRRELRANVRAVKTALSRPDGREELLAYLRGFEVPPPRPPEPKK